MSTIAFETGPRNLLIAWLVSSAGLCLIACTGCQGIGLRGGDAIASIGEDDDWAHPSAKASQVPRPSLSTQRRLSDHEAAASPSMKNPLAPTSTNPPSSIPSTAKPPTPLEPLANTSAASATNIIATPQTEVDIDGALDGLPAPYRDLLKRQLAAANVQTPATQTTSKPPAEVAASELTTASADEQKAPSKSVSIRLSDNDDPKQESSTSVPTEANPTKEATAIAQATTPKSAAPSTMAADVQTASVQVPATPTTPSNPVLQAAAITEKGSNSPSTSAAVPSHSSSLPQLPPAVSEKPNPASWNQSLASAIEMLEKQIKEQPSGDEALRLHQELTLRMLYVSIRKLDNAMRPIDGISEHENEYYRNQMMALYEASNPDAMPARTKHLTLVMNSQREATNHLAAASNLEVRGTSFCTEVERYGVFTKFPKYQFLPDQEVLLYCELENVATRKVRDGFESQLQGSYEIIDNQGRAVAVQILPMEPDICQNLRRDYFIVYKIYMPQQIASGAYKLRLTIEDMNARKVGQASLDFQIKKQ